MGKATSASLVQAPTRTEGLRFALRRATKVEHDALDTHPAFAALMDGTLSFDGYRRLMSLFHAFYVRHDRMLEDACARFSLDRLGFSYAPRSGILADDLVALGGTFRRSGQTEPVTLPAIDSIGRLGGFLYVFEGSMLGGGVLCRKVEAMLAPNGVAGQGYWRWCRDAGAERWAMTCRMLERIEATVSVQAEMAEGSRTAFMTFAGWLDCWQDDLTASVWSTKSFLQC